MPILILQGKKIALCTYFDQEKMVNDHFDS